MKINKRFFFSLAACAMFLSSACQKDTVDSLEIRTQLHQSGASTHPKAAIVIMGDGFTAGDLLTGGSFETAAKQLTTDLFSVEPYKTYINDFDVHFVYVPSQEQGVGHGKVKKTVFECNFLTDNNIAVKDDIAFKVATEAIPNLNLHNSIIVVLANDPQYGGTTAFKTSDYETFISTISVSTEAFPREFKRLVLREVGGRGFGRLALEYGNKSVADFNDKFLVNQLYTQYGFYANVDITNEPTAVKWSHFFEKKVFYPEVDIYEGGFGCTNGIFHPDNNNVMLERGDLCYDAPSREAIVKRIYQVRANLLDQYFFYKFINKDIK